MFQMSNSQTVIASEAKQSIERQERMDCFVALLLAMTLRYNFAISRPDMPEACWKFSQPSQSEGAGNAGRSMHPQPRMQNKNSIRA
jgi:hypothetical protein